MEQSDQRNWNPDLVTTKDLENFLRIDRTAVAEVMKVLGVPKRGAGYPWIRIWVALGVDLSTVKDPDTPKAPLMELKEVAALLGESPKTTRRRGDGKHRDKSIPNHIDLGPRKRLYFPGEIQSWISGKPVPSERKQVDLSFIPSKQKKSSPPKKSHKEARVAQPSQVSAASLFMAPPNPV